MAAEEARDSDEDVIMPYSPLSSYIHELENLECNELYDSENIGLKSFASNNSNKHKDKSKDKCSLFRAFSVESIKMYLCQLYSFCVPSFIYFESNLLKHTLKCIESCKVLTPEDLTFLKNWESEDFVDCKRRPIASSTLGQWLNLIGLNLILMILIIICDFEFWNLKLSMDFMLLLSFSCIVYLIFYLNCAIIIFALCINLIQVIYCTILVYRLRRLSYCFQSVASLFKKSIRLIQEAELIARGFTNASMSGIAQRIELAVGLPIASSQRQYLELRKSMFSWAKDIFMSSRYATLHLIETVPISPEFNFSSHSLAALDIKEFGDLLKYDLDSDTEFKELLVVSDDLCLSALRTVYQLMELQVSELFKYICLVTSFAISEDEFLNTKKIKKFHILNFNVGNLLKGITSLCSKSDQTYKYYRSVEASYSAEEQKSIKNESKHQLEVTVHNMILHLKAALKRLIEIEANFDVKKNADDSPDATILRKVVILLNETKSEVCAYEEEYNSCTAVLEELLDSNKNESVKLIPPSNSQKGHDSVIKPLVMNKCDLEPEIYDEVFEAIATHSAQSDDYYEKASEPEVSKIITEVTSNLMHELKNILVVKADECRVREEKALAKKCGIVNALTDVLDTSQDHGRNIDNPDVANIENDENCDKRLLNTETLLTDNSNEILSSDRDSHVYLKNTITENESHLNMHALSQNTSDLPQAMIKPSDCFAFSIASLAKQRQKMLGVSPDMCFGDDDDDDGSEICE